jgi:hypothetical protein
MANLYPIGVQDFEKLRKKGYLYLDKTKLIYSLVTTGNYYFLGRPRRFGKSLLISTLEAYFKGKRELFKGLFIEQLEKDWTAYPVLHLDLNAEKYDGDDRLENMLDSQLRIWEKEYGVEDINSSSSIRFKNVILAAYKKTGLRVVVLVDEYDKPLLQAIGDSLLQESFRNTLKAFYGVLKSMDAYIKFGLLTGVTKFGKVSVFSDLNNLEDISMSKEFTAICGITEQELSNELEDDVRELATAQGMSYEDVRGKLREWYDGYHFTYNAQGIYNPFSVLNAFKQKEFGNYWFATGTPTYLVDLLKKSNYDLHDIGEVHTDVPALSAMDTDSKSPIPMLYQSGYLTIKGYDEEFRMLTLSYPNKEVEEGFVKFLLPFYTDKVSSVTA